LSSLISDLKAKSKAGKPREKGWEAVREGEHAVRAVLRRVLESRDFAEILYGRSKDEALVVMVYITDEEDIAIRDWLTCPDGDKTPEELMEELHKLALKRTGIKEKPIGP
jgi:hypothetical protein